MELNELQKWNLIRSIFNQFRVKPVITHIEAIPRDPNVKYVKKTIQYNKESLFNPIPDTYRIGIIDFEGNPTFLGGLFLHDVLFTFYIENSSYQDMLYLTILEILKQTREVTLFSFSTHEKEEILRIYRYLEVQGYDLNAYKFVETLPIINLQKEPYESLTEAIYSLHPKSIRTTGDSLFRNTQLIDKLYSIQKFEDIIAHNHNCLLNEGIIFLQRWLKLYTI